MPTPSAEPTQRADFTGSADPTGTAGLSLSALIRSDVTAAASLKGHERLNPAVLADVLMLPGVWCGIVIRLANWFHDRGLKPISRILYVVLSIVFSAEWQPGTKIGPGLVVAHHVGIAAAKGVEIGANCHVMGGVRLGGAASEDPDQDGVPTIGDDCWFLDGAKVFGPVAIADGVVVAGSSMVTSTISEPNVIVAGVPAKIVRHREPALTS